MKLRITVHGVAYEVDVEVLDAGNGFPAPSTLPSPPAAAPVAAPALGSPGGVAPPIEPARVAPAGDAEVRSPVAGTVQEVRVKAGVEVAQGDVLVIVEAMKMNTSITAPRAGTIQSVPVAVGDTVREEETLVVFA